jgi:hypothetical protein
MIAGGIGFILLVLIVVLFLVSGQKPRRQPAQYPGQPPYAQYIDPQTGQPYLDPQTGRQYSVPYADPNAGQYAGPQNPADQYYGQYGAQPYAQADVRYQAAEEVVLQPHQYLQPAAFSVTDLMVTPGEVRQNQPVTILAQVQNTGGTRGRHSLHLVLDGRPIGVKEVTVDAGAVAAVNFTLSEELAGEHTVVIDGVQAKFFIAPARFTVSNLNIKPERVPEGQKARVSILVSNEGGCAGDHKLELKIGNEVEAYQEVSLAPGASQVVSFEIDKRRPGFYVVEVGNLSGRLNVIMDESFEKLR